MNFSLISDQTVLSVDEHGQVLSRFGDAVWHLPQFKIVKTDKTSLFFDSLYDPKNEHSHENIRILKFLLLVMLFSRRKNLKSSQRITTIKQIAFALRSIVHFSNEQRKSIARIIDTPALYNLWCKSMTVRQKQNIMKCIKNYQSLTDPCIQLTITKEFLNQLKDKPATPSTLERQTAVIPTRIFQQRWTHYSDVISEFLNSADALETLITACTSNPNYALAIITQKDKLKKSNAPRILYPTWPEAVSISGLTELLDKHSIKSRMDISSYLHLVQYCAKCLIHTMTLMRDKEALGLSPNCLESAEGWNKEGVYLVGISTKGTGTASEERWITVEAIQTPLLALIRICDIVEPFLPDQFKADNILFPSAGFLPYFRGRRPKHPIANLPDHLFDIRLPAIYIEETDIKELELIDPLRDWRSEESFRPGARWRITSHQFRRTVTVYAAQHKAVTIGALKRALIHLTILTTNHYQKGCSAGTYKLSDYSPELVAEMHNAVIDASAASYVRNVLHSEEHLYGVEGGYVQKLKDQGGFVLKYALEEVRKRRKKGLIACIEMPIGLCVSLTPCDKRAHGDFTTCDGCRNSIIKLSSLDATIEILQIDLDELDPSSMEYRMDAQNLSDLLALRDRIVSRKSSSS